MRHPLAPSVWKLQAGNHLACAVQELEPVLAELASLQARIKLLEAEHAANEEGAKPCKFQISVSQAKGSAEQSELAAALQVGSLTALV